MIISNNFSKNSNISAHSNNIQKNKAAGFGSHQVEKDVFKASIKALEKKIESTPNKGIFSVLVQKAQNLIKRPSVEQLVPQIQESYLRAHAVADSKTIGENPSNFTLGFALLRQKLFIFHAESLVTTAAKKEQKSNKITLEEAREKIMKKAGL